MNKLRPLLVALVAAYAVWLAFPFLTVAIHADAGLRFAPGGLDPHGAPAPQVVLWVAAIALYLLAAALLLSRPRLGGATLLIAVAANAVLLRLNDGSALGWAPLAALAFAGLAVCLAQARPRPDAPT